jgi:chromosome segregation ATPase
MKERHEQETQKLRRELDASQASARAQLTQADQLRAQLTDLQARHDEALRHSDVIAMELRSQLAHAQSECTRLRSESGEMERTRARLLAAEEAGAILAETVRKYEAEIKHLKQEVP